MGNEMSSTAAPVDTALLQEKIEDFEECLKNSKRVIALLGAGFSAASGLPTFRGAGGLWRNYEATSLATPEAFEENPGLVWEFYSYRRHMSLSVKPNPGHYALAELAKIHPNFITLSQNVDGLSPRAGHPAKDIYFLHGDLFTVKCSDTLNCDYTTVNYDDPIHPSLARASSLGPDQQSNIPRIPDSELPHCPKCNELLRPGVVWFGEALPQDVISSVKDWIKAEPKIDLIMVIGTSSTVYPAAAYVDTARTKGARVAVVNLEPDDVQRGQVRAGDWLFEGDSSKLLPEMLKSVIGELKTEGELKTPATASDGSFRWNSFNDSRRPPTSSERPSQASTLNHVFPFQIQQHERMPKGKSKLEGDAETLDSQDWRDMQELLGS